MEIRKAAAGDIAHLLPLMRELAEFEKYAADFVVTGAVLREQGFLRSPPDFHCLIAEDSGDLVGFLVYYFVPYTYRAKPNLIIKELYIAEPHRGRGAGKLLMKAVAKEAALTGCGMIKWWVAKWNERGIKFYERGDANRFGLRRYLPSCPAKPIGRCAKRETRATADKATPCNRAHRLPAETAARTRGRCVHS